MINMATNLKYSCVIRWWQMAMRVKLLFFIDWFTYSRFLPRWGPGRRLLGGRREGRCGERTSPKVRGTPLSRCWRSPSLCRDKAQQCWKHFSFHTFLLKGTDTPCRPELMLSLYFRWVWGQLMLPFITYEIKTEADRESFLWEFRTWSPRKILFMGFYCSEDPPWDPH